MLSDYIYEFLVFQTDEQSQNSIHVFSIHVLKKA